MKKFKAKLKELTLRNNTMEMEYRMLNKITIQILLDLVISSTWKIKNFNV
ncbi:hypothetical protein Q428_13200 [Fervidicella metallireducens AeB]|uniref:Uncharacterized protein n=1 Tax=Fervidicella metallireducens AeB TaxID=1403537 RepID=A0A017RUA1_9CLOT|nr:hypothetical protein [Fervidicella metallireducens]EYE87465.1 hypothetical protein Q428_13200 [Fervidicella metallireducens AeB]